MFREKTARRAGFSFAELLVVMLIMVIVIGFLLIGIQKLRVFDPGSQGGGRTQTVNNLKQVTLACHSFVDVHKKLPPAFDKFGDMTFPASVHIHLAPFVEQDNFYKLYVNAEGKGEITKAIVWPYLSPQDNSRRHGEAGVQNFAANLRVFSDKGYNTPFDFDVPA